MKDEGGRMNQMGKKKIAGAGLAELQDATAEPVSSAPASSDSAFILPPSSLPLDLSYISAGLRGLAVRVDSLVPDDRNVKDHGESDLPTHAASLRQFGIRRALVVRRANRMVEAGNGTLAAAKLNGWEFVPVLWEDDDERTAKAFSLADNAVGTLAGWNSDNLTAAVAEVGDLFDDELMRSMSAELDAAIKKIAEEEDGSTAESEEAAEEDAEKSKPAEVELVYRVVVTVKDHEQQVAVLAEMVGKGFECSLTTKQVEK